MTPSPFIKTSPLTHIRSSTSYTQKSSLTKKIHSFFSLSTTIGPPSFPSKQQPPPTFISLTSPTLSPSHSQHIHTTAASPSSIYTIPSPAASTTAPVQQPAVPPPSSFTSQSQPRSPFSSKKQAASSLPHKNQLRQLLFSFPTNLFLKPAAPSLFLPPPITSLFLHNQQPFPSCLATTPATSPLQNLKQITTLSGKP